MAAVTALAAVAVVITKKRDTFGLNGIHNSVIPFNPFSSSL
jgi:hypothetical protein